VLRHSSDVKEERQRTGIDREHGNGRMALDGSSMTGRSGLRGPKNLNEDKNINKFWHGSPPYV
jgi:hypothetical protein